MNEKQLALIKEVQKDLDGSKKKLGGVLSEENPPVNYPVSIFLGLILLIVLIIMIMGK